MSGIQRHCAKCKTWKAPVHFRQVVLRGVQFAKACRACRGEVRRAAA